MDQTKKAQIQGKLMTISAKVMAASSAAAALNNTTFPVAGNMVMIHSLPGAAQAINMQSECIADLVKVVEKLLDEA